MPLCETFQVCGASSGNTPVMMLPKIKCYREDSIVEAHITADVCVGVGGRVVGEGVTARLWRRLYCSRQKTIDRCLLMLTYYGSGKHTITSRVVPRSSQQTRLHLSSPPCWNPTGRRAGLTPRAPPPLLPADDPR
ncbi:hypothetical protein E2C01_006780 [Portunus trituberculatus]|uniref:Uncharacterized protein n=1 Tax=Portunus trituberculatus TaxID=210409 RepID=A0A5B7CXP5_PORTR|nr:hypothetical protein [Portunus trituberculatus]